MRAGYHPQIERASQKKDTSLKKQGFYHTTAWRRVRLLALQRDNYLCQECLRKKKITPATEVHHVLELEDHPELGLELDNLTSLCWQCHEDTKRRPRVVLPGRINIIRIRDGSETEGWTNAD